MDAKLISLLIYSNAAVIEAISEHARQTSANYSENNFWNLRQECVALAAQAEEFATATQEVKVSVSAPTPEPEGLTRLMLEELTDMVMREPKVLQGRRLMLKQDNGSDMTCMIQHCVCVHGMYGHEIRFQFLVEKQGDTQCNHRTVRTMHEFERDFIKWL